MTGHKVVASDEWLRARMELLASEKEFTRLRDQLSQQRVPHLLGLPAAPTW